MPAERPLAQRGASGGICSDAVRPALRPEQEPAAATASAHPHSRASCAASALRVPWRLRRLSCLVRIREWQQIPWAANRPAITRALSITLCRRQNASLHLQHRRRELLHWVPLCCPGAPAAASRSAGLPQLFCQTGRAGGCHSTTQKRGAATAHEVPPRYGSNRSERLRCCRRAPGPCVRCH